MGTLKLAPGDRECEQRTQQNVQKWDDWTWRLNVEEQGRSHEGCVRNAQCDYLRGRLHLVLWKECRGIGWHLWKMCALPPFCFPYPCQLLIFFCKVKNVTLCWLLPWISVLDKKWQSSVLGTPERTEMHWAEKLETWRIIPELFWEVLKPLLFVKAVTQRAGWI